MESPKLNSSTLMGPNELNERVESDAVLSVAGLTKRFGDVLAVDDVSFSLQKGEFLTLLGESGCGKSTTLMMIAGFEPVTKGKIFLENSDLTTLPPHKRGLGVVFQNYALFPNMSVIDNVAYPLKMRGVKKKERRERARSALSLVRLEGHASYFPTALSGGQQQRVALARSLVFNPDVLLMDEPLGALDKKLREHLQAELRMLHRDHGVTVVYVTHDQDEALSLSDRIAVMRSGRIEQIGSPFDIYCKPNSEFVADFVGESTLLVGTISSSGDALNTNEALGAIPIEPNKDLKAGSEAGLVIRPENVSFADPSNMGLESSAPLPTLKVEITDVGFYGHDIRFECRGVDYDFSSVVRVPRDYPEQPRPSEHAWITWQPQDAAVFNRNG
jgi:putative spermidine/putrescine transport system ATP-binding protein